jgi:hypothetical protein
MLLICDDSNSDDGAYDGGGNDDGVHNNISVYCVNGFYVVDGVDGIGGGGNVGVSEILTGVQHVT